MPDPNTVSTGQQHYDYQFTFQGEEDTATSSNTTQTTAATSVTVNAYEGEDGFVSDENALPLNFRVNRSPYEALASNPTLQGPNADRENGAPEPLGVPGQSIVRKAYIKEIMEGLNHFDPPLTPEQKNASIAYLLEPDAASTLTPNFMSSLDNLDAQVTRSIQEKANLPQTWTIRSTSNADWTPIEPEPYTPAQRQMINQFFSQQMSEAGEDYIQQALEADPPLITQEEVTQLRSAIAAGSFESSDPAINEHLIPIKNAALQVTQTKYGLPPTWVKGAQEDYNWEPVNLTITNPTAVQAEHLNMILNGVMSLSTNIQEVIDAAMNSPIPAVADGMRAQGLSMKEFLKEIGDAIKDLKHQLAQMQIADAEKSEQTNKTKFSALEDRKDLQTKQHDAQKAQQAAIAEQMEKAKKTQTFMKIMGPVIAFLSVVAAIAITVGTGGIGVGAAAWVAGAGIALGVAMLGYSIADSILDLSSKVMEAFASAIDSLTAGMSPGKRALIRGLIIAAIIIAGVVLMAACASGIGAVANGATSAAMQAASQVAKEMVTQLIFQWAAVFAMGKGGIGSLATDILEAQGNTSQHDAMVAQIISTIVAMAVMTVGMGAAQQGFGMIGTNLKNAGKEALETAATLGRGVLSPMQSVKNAIKTVGAAVDDACDYIRSFPPFGTWTRAALNKLTQTIEDVGTSFTQSSNLRRLEYIAALAPPVVTIVASVESIAIRRVIIALTREIADNSKAEEELKIMIDLLEKLLKNLQSGLGSSAGDFMEQLQETMNGIYRGLSKEIGKLSNAAVITAGRG